MRDVCSNARVLTSTKSTMACRGSTASPSSSSMTSKTAARRDLFLPMPDPLVWRRLLLEEPLKPPLQDEPPPEGELLRAASFASWTTTERDGAGAGTW